MKKLILFIGLGMSIVGYLFMMCVFFITFFTETQKVIWKLNTYGEANIEFVILMISIPFVLYFIIKTIGAIKCS